ncbi:unnamed protein product [Coccothraustes coccothraustes]
MGTAEPGPRARASRRGTDREPQARRVRDTPTESGDTPTPAAGTTPTEREGGGAEINGRLARAGDVAPPRLRGGRVVGVDGDVSALGSAGN